MQAGENYRKMILNDIKESITKALYFADKKITVYFEKMETASFPFFCISVKDFRVEAGAVSIKTKYEFLIEIVSMKSPYNKPFELLEMQEILKSALVPCITVKNKKITLDDVVFKTVDKKLVMDFRISFYEIEDDTTETMQTLDITIKENNYAR